MADTDTNQLSARERMTGEAGEREMLETFLDLYRDVVVAKIRDLSPDDLGKRLVPSLTTAGGVLKHLRWVEVGWFQQVLTEEAGDSLRPHERDWEFQLEPHDTADSLVADYQAACARSRELAAGYDLDHTAPHRRKGPVSLRWIYLHMIEETARHAGHLDILREQIDGCTGYY